MLLYLIVSAAGQSASELPKEALLGNGSADPAAQLEHDVAVAALTGGVGRASAENATANATGPSWTTASLSAAAWERSFASARRRCRAGLGNAWAAAAAAPVGCLPGEAGANLTDRRSGESVTCKDKKVNGETFLMEWSFRTVTCDWFGEDPQLQRERCEKAGSMKSYPVQPDSASPPQQLNVTDACCFCGGGLLRDETPMPGDIIPLLGGRRAWNYDDLGPLPDRMEVQNLSDPKHLRFVARHQLLRARIANIFQASGTLPPLPNVTDVPPRRVILVQPSPTEEPDPPPRKPCSEVPDCREFKEFHDDLRDRIGEIWLNRSDQAAMNAVSGHSPTALPGR